MCNSRVAEIAHYACKNSPNGHVPRAMHHNIKGAVDHLVDAHEGKDALVGVRKSRQISGARRETLSP